MMKRIFTLITSIVLATSLLAVPAFAAEPEDLPTPQPGVTETEQPDGSDQPENPDRPSIQPCDVYAGRWRHGLTHKIDVQVFFRSFLTTSNPI